MHILQWTFAKATLNFPDATKSTFEGFANTISKSRVLKCNNKRGAGSITDTGEDKNAHRNGWNCDDITDNGCCGADVLLIGLVR